MKKLLIGSTMLLALATSCLDKSYLNQEPEIAFKSEPKWALPAVYGEASLRDIIVGQDEDKQHRIIIGENGILTLYNRFPSVYRVSLSEIVAPEKTTVERDILLPPLTLGLPNEALLALAQNLPAISGEIEIPLPEEIKEIKRFVGSTRIDLVIPPAFPLEADYEITFPTATMGGSPLVLRLSNPDAEGRYTAQLDRFEVTAPQSDNKVRLPYKLRVIPKSIRQAQPSSQLRAVVRLSSIKGHIFEGKISDQTDITIDEPISFDYDSWPKIENLALLGSKLSVEAKYRGRIGLGLKSQVSVTTKQGKKLTLKPSIPVLELDATAPGASSEISREFSGEDIDSILIFLSDLGISVEDLSINFTNRPVYIDEDSFVDLSLVLEIPLHLKFSRMPIEFNFSSPIIKSDELLKKEDTGLNKIGISLKTQSSLPLGIQIKGLTLLDREKEPIEGGFIPFDFVIAHSTDGKPVESIQRISISRKQATLLPQSRYIRFEGAAVSSGDWMQLRPEQRIGFSIAILTNE